MTVREALREGAGILAGDGPDGSPPSPTPSLDASLLLAFALGLSRDRLLASGPDPVAAAPLERYRALLAERARGRPVAYLVGTKEFWGRDFLVDGRVLIPRPDTELLVELALRLGDGIAANRMADNAVACHECCVGSGCVAISLALERPRWQVSASDLSEGALEVARANAARLLPSGEAWAAGRLWKADLLDLPPEKVKEVLSPAESGSAGPGGAGPGYDLILANPPYVGSTEARELAEAWGEPVMALDGGEDGLDPYRRLLPQAVRLLAPGGCLLLEADPSQAADLRKLLASAGLLAVETYADLAGYARVTLGRKPWTN